MLTHFSQPNTSTMFPISGESVRLGSLSRHQSSLTCFFTNETKLR
jgi:hypothetical protein